MTPRRWLLLLAASLAIVLFIGRDVAGIYGEWTWYAAMGALPLYKLRLWHEWGQRVAAFLLAFAFAFPNLYAVRRSIVSLVLPRRIGNLDIGEAVPGRYLTLAVSVLAVLIALALAQPLDDWTLLATARLGLPFGELEPFHDRDLGFYVYRLPFERSVQQWARLTALTVFLLVVVLYAITPSLRWQGGRLAVTTYVRRHLSMLASCLILLVAWSYRIDGLALLSNGSGAGGAFSAFDHLVATPALTGLSLGSLLAAFVVGWAGWHGYHRVLLVVLGALLIAGPVERSLLPFALSLASTDAERRAVDRPYLRTQAAFTRRAFAIEQIVSADSVQAPVLTVDALPRHLSDWDPAALARSASYTRRGGAAVAIDFDVADGTLLGRVLERPAADGAPWWTVTSIAGAADERGNPLSPFGSEGSPDAERHLTDVRIWAAAPSYALAAESDTRVVATPFDTWPERLGHAWHLRKPALLWSDSVPPGTRIVYHRDIRARVDRMAPFFTQGPTVQAVVEGDSLFWIVDLFSAFEDYPLAEPVPFAGAERRYVRHAATAVVQAQTGRVTLFADPHADAYARTWTTRFPELFRAAAAMPPALAARRAPNADLLALQGAVLTRTGFAGDSFRPRTLALAGDADVVDDAAVPMMALGGERLLARSLALVGADDAVWGVLVATGGAAPHTLWYRRTGAGQWTPLLSALQHAADSVGFAHGRARRGRVTVVPFAAGLAYVQSFYDWPADDPPRLSGVVVAIAPGASLRGGATRPVAVRAGRTLADALGLASTNRATSSASWRARVAALYDAMAAALRRGDWNAFGKAFRALGLLRRAAP